MHEATLKALKESKEHWQRMREDPWGKEEPTSGQCALCRMFLYDSATKACDGCPIFEKTGEAVCVGTPYAKAYQAFYQARTQSANGGLDDWHESADRMIEFLDSLIPKDQTTEEK